MKFLIILCALISQIHAQDFASMFSPKQPLAVLALNGQLGDPARESEIATGIRLYSDEKQNFGIGGKWRRLGFKGSDPRLLNYEEIEAGFNYRRTYSQDKFWSISANYGSASDQVFKNSDVSFFEVTGLVKFNQRWYGALNFSTNRTFANNIPLPGFFYVHTMTREKILIFGLPFAFIKIPITESLSFQYLGILPWRHSLKLTLERKGPRPYLFIQQTPESLIPSQRTNEDDRFYWARREVGIGLEGRLQAMQWDLAVGSSFKQQFYVAEDFNDSTKTALVEPENAGFLRLNLKYIFK